VRSAQKTEYKVPTAGEISLLVKYQIVSIGGKKRVRHDGMSRGPRIPLKNAEGIQVVRTWWRGVVGTGGGRLEWSVWEAIGGRFCALKE